MKKKIAFILICIFLAIFGWFNNEKISFKTAIDAIEKSRGIHVGDILLQKDIDNGQVVFYLRKINDDRQIVSAEFVKKTILGWKWVYGGGHSIPIYTGADQEIKVDKSWSYQYLPSTIGTEFGKSPFPMLFGVIQNSDVTSIIVRNLSSYDEQNAEIVKVNNSLRFWFCFIKEKHGRKFTISAISNKGMEISVKNIGDED